MYVSLKTISVLLIVLFTDFSAKTQANYYCWNFDDSDGGWQNTGNYNHDIK